MNFVQESKNKKSLQETKNRKVIDLLREQDLIKAKYFIETEQPFIVQVTEGQDEAYLKEQVQMHYEEVSQALERYMEIEDLLSVSYANTFVEVMGYRFTVATGVKLLQEIEHVKRNPFNGNYMIDNHPMGIFLSMCSVSFKVDYAYEPRRFVDPVGLVGDTVIEDMSYKVEEFLIQLKYAIQKSNYETEV